MRPETEQWFADRTFQYPDWTPERLVAAKRGSPGSLILSEFAGCAVELPQAVLTNPYSKRNLDRALDEALDMPAAEAAARMQAMEKAVHDCDIACWADHIFGEFEAIGFESRSAAVAA